MKFQNGQTDLTKIEIVLTDFGMAGSDSNGGTPVFASPECFEHQYQVELACDRQEDVSIS